ncbi:hypothetical protein E8D34_08675 [Nocardioides sp. GY 10113]|uniref:hypothetical protein n=1 Tax=Nocardioides sp. GY 10113 TaxID=2569761 RepID=UPI0010A81BD2|nr:hypothetical protein [Nocardioides sp. GY 10113]TIC87738.1 hypothetical protein E8D34_08675 [Nocardioides sp. GY 10113]
MSHEDEVLSRLVDYHDHISAPHVPVADDLHRGRRRVRRNRGLLAGAGAVALASVIAAGSLLAGERPTDSPLPADRRGLHAPLVAPDTLADVREFGFHVEAVPDLVTTGNWAIDPDRQSIGVMVLGVGGGLDLSVAVYYEGRAPDLPSGSTGQDVSVNGRSGTYVESVLPGQWSAILAWEYAPGLWAEVSTPVRDSVPPSDLRSRMLTAAEAVRPGGEAVLIPVRVGTLPASLPSAATAHDTSVQYFDGDWSWWLSFNDEVHLWATSGAGTDCQGSDGTPFAEDFTYQGHPGCLVDGERIGLRLEGANVFIDFVDAEPKPPIDDLKKALADLTVASRDPATWFDLSTALGR